MIKISLALSIVLMFGNSYAQSSKPTGTYAVVPKPNPYKMERPSFKSKVYRTGIRIKGIKKGIEKEFQTGDFSKTNKAADIPEKLKRQCDISCRQSPAGRTVWELSKKNMKPERHLLYLHGGAYVHNITKYDWALLDRIVQQTGYGVVIPDYPLAPQYNYIDVYNMVVPLYEALLQQAGGRNVVLLGFSAGGGIALSLAQYAKNNHLAQPAQIILLSPLLDATLQNPQIPSLDKYDPYLGLAGLKKALSAYAGDGNTSNHRVSPINGVLEGLAPIHLFMGTHEILLPDARRLVALARAKNVHINYHEYAEMYHGWVFLKMPEADSVFHQLMRILL